MKYMLNILLKKHRIYEPMARSGGVWLRGAYSPEAFSPQCRVPTRLFAKMPREVGWGAGSIPSRQVWHAFVPEPSSMPPAQPGRSLPVIFTSCKIVQSTY